MNNIKVLDTTFYTDGYIRKPLSWTLPSNLYFDKDGYELNIVEQDYYTYNGIDTSLQQQYHHACQMEWLDIQLEHLGVYVDHCMLVQRFAYADEARQQIQDSIPSDPTLRKLLDIRPKYGLDISLDYIKDDYCFELFHYEVDFIDINEALSVKKQTENLVLSLDFDNLIQSSIDTKFIWESLCSDDQSDYKAKLAGFDRAFDNLKVIGS